MLVCAILALPGCTPATVPQLPPLDDAIAHVQLADPLASLAEKHLGVPLTPEKLRGSTRCPFNGQARRFDCPASVSGTLTYHRSYQLLGADAWPVADWDEKVASIRLITTVTGRVGSFDVTWRDDATLGDLRELRQTLRGTSTLDWSDGASAWSSQRTTELQVLSRARMPGKFPSGTIQLGVALAAPAERRSASMTFDGSPIASMLLSFDGRASVRCRIDLQSPESAADCE